MWPKDFYLFPDDLNNSQDFISIFYANFCLEQSIFAILGKSTVLFLFCICLDMKRFSRELVNEITAYFSEKYNIQLSEEKAEEYLKALADLCLSFIEK
jgi:hypothetical protein